LEPSITSETISSSLSLNVFIMMESKGRYSPAPTAVTATGVEWLAPAIWNRASGENLSYTAAMSPLTRAA
jgi:hypothetical protein